ncbi:MAG TPA: hypothetical protein VHV74_07020 [Pseudonocardiaceae bacterium]|jgi:beta-lactamase class A|nr:hypothetical protein [Pseudonocardiaceae bacterium]
MFAYADSAPYPWLARSVRIEMTNGAPVGGRAMRWRLTPDFASDATRWPAKTDTLLNLRHEVGVAEHEDGSVYAVAALTDSTIVQPEAEALMAGVAKALHNRLRAA